MVNGVCIAVARLLALQNTKQKVSVKWNSYVTDPFSTSNGVKRGGFYHLYYLVFIWMSY